MLDVADSQTNMTHGDQRVVEHDEELDEFDHILAGLFHLSVEEVERRVDVRIILVELDHGLLILHDEEEQRRAIGEYRGARVLAAYRVEKGF